MAHQSQNRLTRVQFEGVLACFPGVTWDRESEQGADVIQLDSPRGKVFSDNGCHTLVEPFANNGGQSWKPEAYALVASRLRHGLEDCTTPDCDVCEERE